MEIGNDNVIREYCTIHRGSPEGSATKIGDKNFLMAGAHIGHNCVVANNVIIANNCLLAGDVRVDDGWALLAAAAVFGVLNTVLKPILRFATLPLAILTLGIAWFFVSLLMLVITKELVSGFDIHGFWTLVGATLIVWLVNLALDITPGPWQVTGRRRRLRRVRERDRD